MSIEKISQVENKDLVKPFDMFFRKSNGKYGKKAVSKLGQGAYGIVLLTEKDFVIKLTDDSSEPQVIQKLGKIKTDIAPQYHQIYKFKGKGVRYPKEFYLIVMEKIKPVSDVLDNYEMTLFTGLLQNFFKRTVSLEHLERNSKILNKLIDEFDVKEDSELVYNLLIQMPDILYKLYTIYGINHEDLHAGNVGVTDTKKVVLYDIMDNSLYNEPIFDSEFMVETIDESKIVESDINKSDVYDELLRYLNHYDGKYGSSIIRQLGEGDNGIVFETDKNYALKVTTDDEEVAVAELLYKINFNFIPKYYEIDIFEGKDGRVYCAYIMEKIVPIEKKYPEYDLFKLDMYADIIERKIDQRYGLEELLSFLDRNKYKFNDTIYNILTKITQFVFEMNQVTGLDIYDIHIGNMGFTKDGEFVLFDLKGIKKK